MIETTIRQSLEDSDAVAALAGTRIRPVSSLPNEAMPYLIYSIGNRIRISMDGWCQYSVEFTAVAETYSQAVQLADAVLSVYPDLQIGSYKSGAVIIGTEGGNQTVAYQVDFSVDMIEETSGAEVLQIKQSGDDKFTSVFGVVDIKPPKIARDVISDEDAGQGTGIGLGQFIKSADNECYVKLACGESTPFADFAMFVDSKETIEMKVTMNGVVQSFDAKVSAVYVAESSGSYDEIVIEFYPISEIGVA